MKRMIRVGLLAVCLMAWHTIDEQHEAQRQGIENALATKIDGDAHAVNMQIAQQLGARQLIIIFDPNTKYKEACQEAPAVYALKRALITAKSPIMTNRSAWENMRGCEGMDVVIAERWHVYASQDQSMVLCIPNDGEYQRHLEKCNDFSAGGTIKNISDGQLLLGIKLDLKSDKEITQSSSLSIKNTLNDLAVYLREMLITHDDLKGWGDTYCNHWDIYLVGHGGKNQIAGMKKEYFPRLLDFLNQQINTRTLFYVSCQAGAHLNAPYEYRVMDEQRAKDLNFTLISGTTLSLRVGTGFLIKKASYKSKSGSEIDIGSTGSEKFNDYFSGLNNYFENRDKETIKNKKITLAEIVQNITPWDVSFDTKERSIFLPTVRFPHTGWFKVTEIENKLFYLSDGIIMRAINQGKNEIRIPKETEIILIDAHYVPIPVILEGNKMPLFMPREISFKHYFFTKIEAKEITIDQFKEMLLNVRYKLSKKQKAEETDHKYHFFKEEPIYEYDFEIDIAIESLIIQNIREKFATGMADMQEWPRGTLEFRTVLVNLKSDLKLVYGNKVGTWQMGNDRTWSISPMNLYASRFKDIKYYANYESTLPKSVTRAVPEPVLKRWTLKDALIRKYIEYKDSPKKLEALKESLPEKLRDEVEKELEKLIIINPSLAQQ